MTSPRSSLRALGPVALVLAAVVALLPAAPAAADQTFGDGPLDVVLDAAATYHDDCATPANRLTVGELAALVLAPSFPETGAPTTQAPAPMTLSRWDDQSALYSYGDRTSWQKAFWHPGIGAWAWDDASLQGFSASDRIDASFIADFTTAFIARRWCTSPSFSTVWAPWYACRNNTCKTIYDQLVDGSGRLVGVDVDSSVARRGGMEAHTCTLGTSSTFRCWYVDPARAQGYRGFAVAAFGPSPVTAPFLGWRDSQREHRHWLRGDTGYSRDIRASLPLGRNSRNGDLAWATGSELCDLTRGVGRCDPLPPPGMDLEVTAVSGGYVPLSGDFDGDGADDVLWYGPGSDDDALWRGDSGDFTYVPIDVVGTYDPRVGDFDGDGRDDVFWYGPGSDPDWLWYGTSTGFASVATSVVGTYDPVVGDFDADGADDVLWYAPGGGRDYVWPGRSGRRFASHVRVTVGGDFVPLPGDFDGDGHGDVFWYGPGDDPDGLWYGRGRGSFADRDISVRGTYEPTTGDLDADGRTDVLWNAPGSAVDPLWLGRADGFTEPQPRPRITSRYRVFTGDFDGSGGDDVFFHRPGSDYDAVWWHR
ncbi:FG-GAP-like repeat-containing protein [Salsipaludibacter albus]|uniref:FG-GAP-like repeat-containing protein n=1 Tax=Salsipaludibacter albus TaxID=2849650 RepID=UPI001EE44891|nr:FG-GAP-like repeat-containing protein [Salsipaludibacter albus]MBY5161211.1 hypothetical protein [Salsipaludibacter albus]